MSDDGVSAITNGVHRMKLKGTSSRASANKTVQEQRDESDGDGPLCCLHPFCFQEFQDFGHFLRHVNQQKHRVPRQKVKAARQNFVDEHLQIHGVSTIEEAQKYADDGKMTVFELKNWRRLNLYLAHLKRLEKEK